MDIEYKKQLQDMKVSHIDTIEGIKRDHLKKSSMARTLLSEREEEVYAVI